jgi:Tyrosine phosphatase family
VTLEQVILDYVQSEERLKESRDKNQLGLEDFLTGDDVIASKAQTLRGTIKHLNERYEGIEHYVDLIGLTREEVACIRRNLSQEVPNPGLDVDAVAGGVAKSH